MTTFWSSSTFEPKRVFRGLLYLPGIKPFMLKSFSKPGLDELTVKRTTFPTTLGRQQIEQIETAGMKLKPLKLVLMDGENPQYNTAMAFYEYLTHKGMADKLNSSELMDASKANEFLPGAIYMTELNANGAGFSWTIINPILVSIDFGEIDYASEELSTVTVGLHYSDFRYNRAPNLDDVLQTAEAVGGELVDRATDFLGTTAATHGAALGAIYTAAQNAFNPQGE